MNEVKLITTKDKNFERNFKNFLFLSEKNSEEIDSSVKKIIIDIKKNKDRAVLRYTKKFDNNNVSQIKDLVLDKSKLFMAFKKLNMEKKNALKISFKRINQYHKKQKLLSWNYKDFYGNKLGQKITPLEKVGIYVPGGKAAYPSSVLMNAIPAKVAGVKEITMTVPAPNGLIDDLVLAAAYISGVNKVIKIGGAQAIASLAFGTESIPKVDKIVGPGNSYVASAKRQVFGQVGIDMIAGPSEIVILADSNSNPDWIAMDLFSQAEHDELAQAILITHSDKCILAVKKSIFSLIKKMPRRKIIESSFKKRSFFIKTRSVLEGCKIINRISPEHLELSIKNHRKYLEKITNAGAIFLGQYSSESLGDYCAGTNHVLPTSGTARFSSGLGVYDFQKKTSIVEITSKGAMALGKVASIIAKNEGLYAHAIAAEMRMNHEKSNK